MLIILVNIICVVIDINKMSMDDNYNVFCVNGPQRTFIEFCKK